MLQTRWSCFISIQARKHTTSIRTAMKSIMWRSYTYADKYHGTIKRQEEEVEELKFFDVDDIPEDISDPIRPVFREYIKMRKRE